MGTEEPIYASGDRTLTGKETITMEEGDFKSFRSLK